MQQKKESELSILKGKTAVVTGSTSGIGLRVRAGIRRCWRPHRAQRDDARHAFKGKAAHEANGQDAEGCDGNLPFASRLMARLSMTDHWAGQASVEGEIPFFR